MAVVKNVPYIFTTTASFYGGFVAGSLGGANLANMFVGAATFNTASATAGSTYVGTFTVANVPAGARVILQPNTLAACTILTGACVTSASTVSASIRTTGSATSACAAITMQYIIFS